MITSVQIFPRHVVAGFIKSLDFDNTSKPLFDWCLITICGTDQTSLVNSEVVKLLNENGCKGVLSLQFDDLTHAEFERDLEYYQKKGMRLMSEDDAKNIVSFIDRMNSLNHNVKLYINCEAGISRSGAVGTFVVDYLQLPFDKFSKMNPHISPNISILSMLKKISGIGY
jgi:predicted protein tyrosine phosphatase